MVEARERSFRRRWRGKPSIASWTRWPRWCRAPISSPARWRSSIVRAQGGVAEATVAHDRHQDFGRQRRAGQRHVRPCRRDRRFRAGHKGASRLRRRARGARDGRARGPIGNGTAQRRHARLRPLLPLSPGARPGSRARDAPQRRGHERHVRRVAAAASLARLDEKGMRYALSYAAQQVSGIWSWVRDAEHVEKAFDFSGMGARNGVTAAIMVADGLHRRLGRARWRAQRARSRCPPSRSRRKWSRLWAAASSSPRPRSSRSPSAIRSRRRWMRSSRFAASTG